MLAVGIEAAVVERRNGIAEALAIRRGQIIECFDHARGADARRLDPARLVDAGGDQDRVVFRAQFLQRRVAADLETGVKDDSRLFESGDSPHDDMLLELEARDAIGQQPPGAIVPVIDVHVIAHLTQIFGGTESRRSRADDTNGLAARRADADGLDPAFVP